MTTPAYLLNNPIDISTGFHDLGNEYFVPGELKDFDTASGSGKLQWNFHRYTLDWFFNKIDKHLEKKEDKGAPFQDYDIHPQCEVSVSFVSARCLRLRMRTTPAPQLEHASLMLDGEPRATSDWQVKEDAAQVEYHSEAGKLVIKKNPFRFELYEASEKLLIASQGVAELQAMHSKALPFSFMRRSADYSRSIAASFTLFPGEKILGCGESFTALNKRGQKIVLWTADAQSTASPQMYKPIPFYFSSRGYGVFVHSSSPMSFDFGQAQDGSQTLYIGEDQLDVFFFIGSPKEILSEYTLLTGRSPLPPLWSFGLWMSRFSYRSQAEVKQVAEKLRQHRIPSDVIHIDAGWFRKGINCDFEFCPDQFPQPGKMMQELKGMGFRTSLWQIPYFTPLNPIFSEVVHKQLFVKDGNGNVATEDAILDFSNEKTREWYKARIGNLLKMGASAIKADFGEAAPFQGFYASGRSGFYEHNLYPLRYNQLVSDLTKKITGDRIIWARSAWAGSQRYPLHWGGDAEVSDSGMAGTLRAGLSFGLSGFTFWSHDIGGFSGSPKEELFKRWAFFGLLSSHSRVHGFPPREPWEFSEDFQEVFRSVTELKYQLMPYVFTQAALACQQGLPLVKALLLNYPEDPTAWMIEDEYLFGNDLLVAPIMEEGTASRQVYLPAGRWIDYSSGEVFEGEKWHWMKAGKWPGILLARWGSLIPHLPLAQSTSDMKWEEVYLIAYGEEEASGEFFDGKEMTKLEAKKQDEQWITAKFQVRAFAKTN